MVVYFFGEHHLSCLLKVFSFHFTPLFEVFYLDLIECDCEATILPLKSHFGSLLIAETALAISVAIEITELADTF